MYLKTEILFFHCCLIDSFERVSAFLYAVILPMKPVGHKAVVITFVFQANSGRVEVPKNLQQTLSK